MSQHSGPLIATRDALKVIDCHACGFAHLDPLPDPALLDKYYRSEFWQHTKAGALTQFEIERPWWDVIHSDWLALSGKHTRERNLLDVGAGYGFFMDLASQEGWNPWGIEPSNAAIEYADKQLGWQPYHCSWEQYDVVAPVDRIVDCISALWLIEHLPSPHEFLLWCYDHLLSGGVLLVACPNDFSAIQTQANRVVKKKNYWLDPTHLNYFTWSSLSNLLGRSGFRIVERTTLFPMEQYLLGGLDYTVSDEIGRACHAKVRASDLATDQIERLKLYQALAYEGRGREIVCVAVKE